MQEFIEIVTLDYWDYSRSGIVENKVNKKAYYFRIIGECNYFECNCADQSCCDHEDLCEDDRACHLWSITPKERDNALQDNINGKRFFREHLKSEWNNIKDILRLFTGPDIKVAADHIVSRDRICWVNLRNLNVD